MKLISNKNDKGQFTSDKDSSPITIKGSAGRRIRLDKTFGAWASEIAKVKIPYAFNIRKGNKSSLIQFRAEESHSRTVELLARHYAQGNTKSEILRAAMAIGLGYIYRRAVSEGALNATANAQVWCQLQETLEGVTAKDAVKKEVSKMLSQIKSGVDSKSINNDEAIDHLKLIWSYAGSILGEQLQGKIENDFNDKIVKKVFLESKSDW
jgi:hypothetical protein